jgi:ABC-type Zn2+ transport system substrate-binding protein/surface adhesin
MTVGVLGGALSHDHDDHVHGHEDDSAQEPHVHDGHEDDTHDGHAHVEAAPPTEPSRAVVINVGEHTGALVLSSNEQRSGIEVEIHPVSRPEARTHVWVLPREGRDGVVYAAVFPSLACGDYAILDLDGSIASVVSVPPNQVTHTTWM